MRQLTFLIACVLALPIIFFAFTPVKNNPDEPSSLLYSEQAMKRLKKEIELKNASFKPRDADKNFIPIPQVSRVICQLQEQKLP